MTHRYSDDKSMDEERRLSALRADQDGELLPCPFCGGPAKCNALPRGLMGQIYCASEECFGPRTTALTKQDSIAQWNTRPTTSDGAREALALAYHELKQHEADYHHRTSVEVNNKIVDALAALRSPVDARTGREVVDRYAVDDPWCRPNSGVQTADDAAHIRSALETLSNPEMIQVDGAGINRFLNLIDRMRSIAATAALHLPTALSLPEKVDGREAVLKMLSGLFSESEHETWTRDEIVNIIEDAIKLGSPSVSSADRGGK